MPEVFSLGPAQPNPFEELVTIAYEIPSRTTAHLAVYDLQGRLVRVLVDREQNPVHHRAQWDGSNIAGGSVAAGQYFCRLVTPGHVATTPLLLVK